MGWSNPKCVGLLRAVVLLLLINRSDPLKITAADDDDPDVMVSRGAVINFLPTVDVYTEMEFIFFMLPDVPEVPATTDITCITGIDKKICEIFKESQEMMIDIKEELKLKNRILTTPGLKVETDYVPVTLEKKWFDTMSQVDVQSDQPSQYLKDTVGSEYISEVEMRLAMRKLLHLNTTDMTKIEKRFVQFGFIPLGLRLVKSLITKADLPKFFEGIFTGNHGILNTLASYRAASSEDKRAFSELSKKVSEFQAETRKLFVEVLSNAENVENSLKSLQLQQYEFTQDISWFKAMVLNHQALFLDLMKMMYVANVYSSHFESWTECRSGKVSPVFVPAALLVDRLKELEKKIPSQYELVYPSTMASRYYKMDNHECLYDSRGGIIKLAVPLRKKDAAYKVFEYRPIEFAYDKYTCSLSTAATYVIKDENTKEIYPITEVELETCQVKKGLCLLPLSADMDSSSVCIALLLKGTPADIIKENCPLQCSERAEPMLSKVLEDIYIGTHLPSTGLTIECPGESIPLPPSPVRGSSKISIACTTCDIYWNGAVAGKSSRNPCPNELRPTVEGLMPIQFTNLKDLMPYDENGLEGAMYASAKEIENEDYVPDPISRSVDNSVSFLKAVGFTWNSVLTVAVSYLMYRYNSMCGAVLPLANAFLDGVESSRDDYTCKLPLDAYYLLCTILILNLCIILPMVVHFVVKFCNKRYEREVTAEATRQRLELAALR